MKKTKDKRKFNVESLGQKPLARSYGVDPGTSVSSPKRPHGKKRG